MLPQITFEQLRAAVAGDAVALRSKMTLQPAGGRGDKVFPPTYAVEGGASHQYAVEERQIGDADKVSCTVLLDSVASQANRAELALLEGWECEELDFPVPYVDFSNHTEVDYEKLTVLEAPHRIADAIFRDSLLDGKLFHLSDIGRAIMDATPRNADALFRYSPTSLLFGMWNSTGRDGGQGSKFQRAYVSEVVGLDAKVGKKVGGRIDPLQIEKVAKDDRVFNSANPEEVWTHDPQQAERRGGQPVPAERGSGKGEAGQPSKINHGNIPPQIDAKAGGVTISEARQTTLISFAALRRLRFNKYFDREAEVAARTAVAALGVAAIAYQHETDFDLRSRCLLLPEHSPRLELLKRDGTASEDVSVDRTSAARILAEAASHCADAKVGWESEEVCLEPAPKLIELIQRSRKASADE